MLSYRDILKFHGRASPTCVTTLFTVITKLMRKSFGTSYRITFVLSKRRWKRFSPIPTGKNGSKQTMTNREDKQTLIFHYSLFT